MKARIVKRTKPDGQFFFVIQRKRWYGWEDVRVGEAHIVKTYETLALAKADLCWYDGTPWKEEVVE